MCEKPAKYEISVDHGPSYFACEKHLVPLMKDYWECWESGTGDPTFEKCKQSAIRKWGGDPDDPESWGDPDLIVSKGVSEVTCSWIVDAGEH